MGRRLRRPRVTMTEDGLYVMAYTSWNRKVARLCIATSRDLVKWEKHGPAFAKAYNGRFKDIFCKSGSMVTEIKNGKQVLTKIDGNTSCIGGNMRLRSNLRRFGQLDTDIGRKK